MDQDRNFTERLSKILNIDTDAVIVMLSKLTMQQLYDLIDAVDFHKIDFIKKLKDRVMPKKTTSPAITPKRNPGASALSDPRYRQRVGKTGAEKEQKKDTWDRKAKHKKPDVEESFELNETVIVDGQEGIVTITNGPGDTVGVMIEGELVMVDKTSLYEEMMGMSGMSMMPDLSSLRKLAGINMDQQPHVIDITLPADHCDDYPDLSDNEMCDNSLTVDDITCRLTEIENCILELPAKDFMEIYSLLRKMTNKLTTMVNEQKNTKSLKDYLKENDDIDVGLTQDDVVKSLQTRMGKNIPTQDAQNRFRELQSHGKIRQVNGRFTMNHNDFNATLGSEIDTTQNQQNNTSSTAVKTNIQPIRFS